MPFRGTAFDSWAWEEYTADARDWNCRWEKEKTASNKMVVYFLYATFNSLCTLMKHFQTKPELVSFGGRIVIVRHP